MPNFAETTSDRIAFFHTLNRLPTREGQRTFETLFDSAGIDKAVSTYYKNLVPFTNDQNVVDTWITNNPNILRKYENYQLTAEIMSNNQAWYINDPANGGRQTPFVTEQLLTDLLTNTVPNAYVLRLYQGASGASPGAQIAPTAGRWEVMISEGFVLFDNGYTPQDMGWGADITCTVYVGIADTTTGNVVDDDDLISQFEAGQDLSGHRVVTTDSVGKIIYMSNDNVSHMNKFIGMTTQAALTGETINVRRYGTIDHSGWNFDVNKPVFLGLNGEITQTPPIALYSLIIGFPETSTKLNISPQKPIKF
jgi:hypothetical protein